MRRLIMCHVTRLCFMVASCNKTCFHCTETGQEVAEMKHKIILVFIFSFNVDYEKKKTATKKEMSARDLMPLK